MNASAGTASIFPPLGAARSRSDLVVESIRAAILAGRLAPGEVLVERRIAEELEVSKTPVREALIVLARSGLVEFTRNRGTTVRRLTFTDVRHVYEMRARLEPWAVGEAVAAPGASFAAAAVALEEATQHREAGRSAEQALANRRFHRAMYEACPNEFVTGALVSLQDLTALATTGVLWENWPTWGEESGEHRAILDAAQRGDRVSAETLMASHIEASIARVREREAAGA